MRAGKANFAVGIAVGVALSISVPLAAAQFVRLAMPASASTVVKAPHARGPQTVNRSAKSDRMYPGPNVTGKSKMRPASIPEGCDPAFSPLSKAAAPTFAGRCLA
jgi:hypothetical protein